MSLLNDVEKTIRYLKRNGVVDTWYAAAERIREKLGTPYTYEAPGADLLDAQRTEWAERGETEYPLISFLVPVYRPNPEYLRQMLESCLAQTYGNFEVVLADATEEDTCRAVVREFNDRRIQYVALGRNGGISANTNAAAENAHGSYVALLDYDDLLTPDAVCEITNRIRECDPEILYSDEDKCDAKAEQFFEPNRKPDFNPDYLLTNNYICHLLVMKRELFLALRLRSSYDGAQDYDLMLRAPWSGIVHIPKVLYHWRTHTQSTAGNPGSKNYAYEAGKAALEEYFRAGRIDASVRHSRHRGFYTVTYEPDIFTARKEVGVVGGKILNAKRRIVGGMMDEKGNVAFLGMHEMESGPMHRADTVQDAAAVDVRCMLIRDELRPLYQSVFHADYDDHIMKEEDKLVRRSLSFCKQAAEMGYLIVWDPTMTKVI